MNHNEKQKAVIYCRVSSIAQTRRGDGLQSQETRCREFARYQGYEVVQVFKDDKTGGLMERAGMNALLAFLRQHRKQPHAVIIDDVSGLARSVKAHIGLRDAIAAAGGLLVSPSIRFDDDADSELQEYIMASVSQHQRQKNGEQTKNRMRARAMNGYWVFHASLGMKYEKVAGHGKLLVRDEPIASYIQEALEGFASGRFETQGEVKRFFESCPAFPKDFPDGSIRFERVNRIMNRVHYAGYIELPDWDISLRKGHHEGLVSLETWQAVQARLNGKARAHARTRARISARTSRYAAQSCVMIA